MANEYRQDGEFLDYTPGTAVAAGEVVVFGERVFVAPKAIAANTPGVLKTCGVWKLAKNTSQAFTAGAILYWNASSDEMTTTSSGNKQIGYAAKAAGASDTEGEVLLGT